MGVWIVWEAGHHIAQGLFELGLVLGVAPQQIEKKAIAFAVVGIGREASRHQLGQYHPGIVEPLVQQGRECRYHLGRQEVGLKTDLVASPGHGLQHAASGHGPIWRMGKRHG